MIMTLLKEPMATEDTVDLHHPAGTMPVQDMVRAVRRTRIITMDTAIQDTRKATIKPPIRFSSLLIPGVDLCLAESMGA